MLVRCYSKLYALFQANQNGTVFNHSPVLFMSNSVFITPEVYHLAEGWLVEVPIKSLT